jgi:hypothetical protein
VVDFLAHLLRHLPGRLLVIWDRSKTHRSHLVGEFVAGQRGRLALDYPAGLRPGTQSGGPLAQPAFVDEDDGAPLAGVDPLWWTVFGEK